VKTLETVLPNVLSTWNETCVPFCMLIMIGMSSYINSPSFATKMASLSGQSIMRSFVVGEIVGETVGGSVGLEVGETVGGSVGLEVGESVGEFVGAAVGVAVGEFVGDTLTVGESVGALLG